MAEQYEEVATKHGINTLRVAVPGGWLYITRSWGDSAGVAQTFIPDPPYEVPLRGDRAVADSVTLSS